MFDHRRASSDGAHAGKFSTGGQKARGHHADNDVHYEHIDKVHAILFFKRLHGAH